MKALPPCKLSYWSQLPASEEDIATSTHIMDAIWQTVHVTDDYHRPTVTALVAAQMQHYGRSREQTIFDRFLQLVTQHCAEHHQIGYYADRMCLTERYLTTVIRQTSGTTAKRLDRPRPHHPHPNRTAPHKQTGSADSRGDALYQSLILLKIFPSPHGHDAR